MKFAQCPYMVFSAPKIEWHLPNTWKDVLHSRQIGRQSRQKTAFASFLSFARSDIFEIINKFLYRLREQPTKSRCSTFITKCLLSHSLSYDLRL